MVFTAPEGVAVKFWTPNLGARVPTNLSTSIPDHSEYLDSGLWCHCRMPRVLQVYDSLWQMVGAGRERFAEADVFLHCLEGQVALLHDVMAFEEANHGRKVLTDTQRWKATFAAYFLGTVSQSQLALLERTTLDTAGVSYTSSNNGVIKTNKRLSNELRQNAKRSLGRLNDAQFENLSDLQDEDSCVPAEQQQEEPVRHPPAAPRVHV